MAIWVRDDELAMETHGNRWTLGGHGVHVVNSWVGRYW